MFAAPAVAQRDNFGELEKFLSKERLRYTGHIGSAPMQYNIYRALTQLLASEVDGDLDVCETGFNAGHSAMMVTPGLESNLGFLRFG